MERAILKTFAVVRSMTFGGTLLKHFAPITTYCIRRKSDSCKQELQILCPIPKNSFLILTYKETIEYVLHYLKKHHTLGYGPQYQQYDKKKRKMMVCNWTEKTLGHNMSAAALEGADKKGKGGCIVAVALCKVVKCADIMEKDPKCMGGKDDDCLVRNVERMFVAVHQKLNLFNHLCLQEIMCISLATGPEKHSGQGDQGNVCCKVVSAALKHAVGKNLQAVKADCVRKSMADCMKSVGMGKIYSLKYDDYTLGGDDCIFPETCEPNDKLRVYAGKLICDPPYVCPLDGFGDAKKKAAKKKGGKKKKDPCGEKKKDPCAPKKKKKKDPCAPKKKKKKDPCGAKKKDPCAPKKKKKKDPCAAKKKKKDPCAPKKKKKKDPCAPKKKKDPCAPKKKKKPDC